MVPSFDCAASSLLCAEDNSSIFDEADDATEVEELETAWHHRNHRSRNQGKSFNGEDFLIGLPVQTDECLALMIGKESQHLPAADYLMRLRSGDLDIGARREVVDWIDKVCASIYPIEFLFFFQVEISNDFSFYVWCWLTVSQFSYRR